MSRPSSFFGQSSIEAREIQLVEKIGTGCFGTVYRGMCRSQEVAVKVPKKQKLTRKAYEAFRKEVNIMSNLYNPYVCLFMGACLAPGNIRIVTELMKGDLESLLHSSEEIPLSTRMKFAKDAATGMAWLHGCNPPVIHRDLKVANMLYDENMRIKVCDFGLSEFQIEEEMFEKEPKGTPLYMAPEVMRKEGITPKVDVYSFGIILWELHTRQEAFAHHTSYEVFRNSVCDAHERPEIPEGTPPSLHDMMQLCWDPDPDKRPSFSEIVPMLEGVISECVRIEHEGTITKHVSDPAAQQFWTEHFLGQDDVGMDLFIDKLYGAFDWEVPSDPSKRPLPERPSEEELATASKYQLEELRGRGDAFAEMAAAEWARRESERANDRTGYGMINSLYGYGYAGDSNVMADESVRQVMCIKALLGDEREKVQLSKFGIVAGAFAPFEGAMLERIVSMMEQPWFHGFMSGREVENMLKNKERGTYLVRFSNSHKDAFVISKVSNRKVIKHVVVPHHAQKGFKLDGYFESLPALIQQHMKNFGLQHPCPGSKYSYLFDDISNEMGGYGVFSE